MTFSMTVLSFPRPQVQLLLLQIFEAFLFSVLLTLNSSTDTNSGVHLNVRHLRCSITSLSYIVLALSSSVTNLPNRTKIVMTFKDRQLNFMTFQAWKTKFLNSMTFQIFHDPYEPCHIVGHQENSSPRPPKYQEGPPSLEQLKT